MADHSWLGKDHSVYACLNAITAYLAMKSSSCLASLLADWGIDLAAGVEGACEAAKHAKCEAH